jgi:hypothetical protein
MNNNRFFVRRFHDNQPAATGLRLQRPASFHGSQPFRPLPAPTGSYPYHLSLASVLPPDEISAITSAQRMVFHLVGDTGGVKTPVPQQNVAHQLALDCEVQNATAQPSFFYHLGDVVYYYGEATEYFPQFYDAYSTYPRPIFAIPGNHDGDLSPAMQQAGTPSLAAFVRNFCASSPHHTPDALDAARLAMDQPNVYWTLETPLATFVGLYTNVPDGGQLDDAQIAWLEQELAAAPADRALLLCMHHPIYSLDDFHSGSVYMHGILENAMSQSGRVPDAVFAGHVHNYQRFTRSINQRAVPFIVAGAGGYHNLHSVSKNLQGNPPLTIAGDSGTEQVTFEQYCDSQFGYLRMEVTPTTLSGTYVAVPGFGDPLQAQATTIDAFTLDLTSHTVTTQAAPASGPQPAATPLRRSTHQPRQSHQRHQSSQQP